MGNKAATSAAMRAYLSRWQRVGPLLETIRREETRQMTEEDYLQAVEQLWSVSVDPEPRTTSGLVQWQRLMR